MAAAAARADEVMNGANSWGWEDTKGGRDHDVNDMIVQLDFTSAAGHGWLV